jgi:very-short-patch-repair endonuclease
VASHRAAADLWGPRGWSGYPEITVARSCRKRSGLIVHQVRHLDPRDTTLRHRIPVTTVPRTFLDLAEVLAFPDLERSFERGQALGLVSAAAIRAQCLRSPGRRGLRAVSELLEKHCPELGVVKSELEHRFLELCRDNGIPLPERNVVIEGYEVDAVWRDAGLIAELDGRAFHKPDSAYEGDRIRNADLQLAGWDEIRITWRRLENQPQEVVATIRRLLSKQEPA